MPCCKLWFCSCHWSWPVSTRVIYRAPGSHGAELGNRTARLFPAKEVLREQKTLFLLCTSQQNRSVSRYHGIAISAGLTQPSPEDTFPIIMDPSPLVGRTTIDIRVLSPSPEVGTGGLQLRNVAVNTTIGALKATIAESIPSHPGPERQRLIYLGRALARDEEELLNIFGRDAVCLNVALWNGTRVL